MSVDWNIKSHWNLVVDSTEFAVPEPQVTRVVDEEYGSLPIYRLAGGWNDGVALRGVAATGCALPMAVDPYSVSVRFPDGTRLHRGKDWELRNDWGTIGRLEDGRIGENQPVMISYRHVGMRLDSVIRRADGTLRLAVGMPAAFCPPLRRRLPMRNGS